MLYAWLRKEIKSVKQSDDVDVASNALCLGIELFYACVSLRFAGTYDLKKGVNPSKVGKSKYTRFFIYASVTF